jgi:hypothetical protein
MARARDDTRGATLTRGVADRENEIVDRIIGELAPAAELEPPLRSARDVRADALERKQALVAQIELEETAICLRLARRDTLDGGREVVVARRERRLPRLALEQRERGVDALVGPDDALQRDGGTLDSSEVVRGMIAIVVELVQPELGGVAFAQVEELLRGVLAERNLLRELVLAAVLRDVCGVQRPEIQGETLAGEDSAASGRVDTTSTRPLASLVASHRRVGPPARIDVALTTRIARTGAHAPKTAATRSSSTVREKRPSRSVSAAATMSRMTWRASQASTRSPPMPTWRFRSTTMPVYVCVLISRSPGR